MDYYHERCVRHNKSLGDMWKGSDKLFVFFLSQVNHSIILHQASG